MKTESATDPKAKAQMRISARAQMRISTGKIKMAKTKTENAKTIDAKNVALKPTIWRTARALANDKRLNLLRLVAKSEGKVDVTRLAKEAKLPKPIASNYLRALNARGLISVVRVKAFVYYGTESDRSLPTAIAIQKAFARLFAQPSLPKNWTRRLIPLFKGYAHPRREKIVKILHESQPISSEQLSRVSDIPKPSLLRHLYTLTSGGIVEQDDQRRFILAEPQDALAAAFFNALCAP